MTAVAPNRRARPAVPALVAAAAAVVVPASQAAAAVATWDGGAADANTASAANWVRNVAPSADDALVFDGFAGLSPANTFAADTAFDGITFAATAGPFVLSGNRVLLHDDVASNSVSFAQTVAAPLLLDSTRDFTAAAGASLTVSGAIAGAAAGFGVTKAGAGAVTLAGVNTFTGPVSVTQGTLNFSADGQLGAVPTSAVAGAIVLNGGVLRATASAAINAGRGIAVGPLFAAGTGTIEAPAGVTLSYAGVVADNDFGGTGSLVKAGAGTLALSGKSTYGGPTVVRTGTLLLDFSQPTSPTGGILASQLLTIGGTPAPGGNAPGTAMLSVVGKATAANDQSFIGTSVGVGNNTVVVAAGSGGGSVDLSLGVIGHVPGGVVAFTLPSGGSVSAGNTPGAVLGGFATVGTDWAYVSASGQLVALPAGNYTNVSGASGIVDAPGANAKLTGLTADIAAVPNAGAFTNVNTISYADNVAGNRTVTIAAGKTLRLGTNGGILHSAANTVPITFGGGTLTAGDATDVAGEIVLNANSSGQTTPVIVVGSAIANNGAGAVTLVKAGLGAAQLTGTSNTYSGGTYVDQGRLQVGSSPGTGPIVVQPGGQAFLSSSTTYTHSFTISGTGTAAEAYGAIRTDNSTTLAGTITLAGDARIQSVATSAGSTKTSTIAGKVTGPFSLETGGAQGNATATSVLVLSNTGNDYAGDTKVSVGSGGYTLRLGTAEVIPSGPGKGNVVLNGGTGSPKATLDLNARNETINGLASTGNAGNNVVTNSGAGTSVFLVGAADQSSTFTGTIQDGASGPISLTKIGRGTLTLNGPLSVASLGVTAGQVTLAAGSGTAKVGSLSAAGKFDVTGNRLVLTGTSQAGLVAMLAAGRAGGTWTGNGLVSSVAAGDANKSTGIAYALASDFGVSTWGTVAGVPSTALLTKVTYYGDLNLDGRVNADDFALLDHGFARNLSGWVNGDADYSGTVTAADYLLVDRSFGLQGGTFSPGFLAARQAEFGDAYVADLLASVPEPSLVGGLVGASPLVVRRRRR